MIRILRRIVIAIVITVALFAAAELAVRLAMPGVNLQGTDRELFAERVWGPSVGMRAGASGSCFGTDVTIDASGCRAIGAPADAARRWLVLGDSVAFGVGVESAETFVGKLQARVPDVRIVHAATLGHSVWNYRDVLEQVLASGQPPERVIVCWCLNDVDGYLLDLPQPDAGPTGWLRANAKLYVAAKSWLTDRSLAYWQHDRSRYEPSVAATRDALTVARTIASRARAAGAACDVFVMPYEAQLRADAADPWQPQRLVDAAFRAGGATVHDLAPAFARAHGGDPTSLYLTADAMHLSAAGHAAAAEAVATALGIVEAGR